MVPCVTIDMELRSGVGLFHAMGAMEGHGHHRQHNHDALDISDADCAAIDAVLTILEDKLGAKLLDLTVEQRSRLTKMGDKMAS